MIDLATEFYETGYSCIDLIKWIKTTDKLSAVQKSQIVICFDEIKSEYRCEKLLLLYMFDFVSEILEAANSTPSSEPPRTKVIIRKKK
jgi:hypothetical protein